LGGEDDGFHAVVGVAHLEHIMEEVTLKLGLWIVG
jgi:hypothetical protein